MSLRDSSGSRRIAEWILQWQRDFGEAELPHLHVKRTMNGPEMPQWKRDLIARLKHQNKKVAAIANVVAEARQSQQPTDAASPVGCGETNGHGAVTMVQQDRNGYHLGEDDSDPEDLHYGPGIVKKLKNKYLSLALRETANRPTVLQLRKATSLENLLEDDHRPRQADQKLFHSRINGNDTRRSPHKNNRYRHANGMEIKRARSVEVISVGDNFHNADDLRRVHNNRQSLHEETFLPRKPYAENTFTDLVHKNPMEIMAIRKSADSSDCNKTSTAKPSADCARENDVGRQNSTGKSSTDSSDCSQTSSEKSCTDCAREIATEKTPNDAVPEEISTKKTSTDSSASSPNSTEKSSAADCARKNLASNDVVRKSSSDKTSTNRPKRLQARIGERERPPQDVVRHAMMIFERRPEQRTRPPKQTGEVAAKVDTFNTIIVKAKVAKKMAPMPCAKGGKSAVVGSDKFFPKFAAPLKSPPTVDNEDKSPSPVKGGGLPSPIPDVSRIDGGGGGGLRRDARLLGETPDLILTSSPLPKKAEAGGRRPLSPPHVFLNGTKSAEVRTPISEPLTIDVNGGRSRSPPLPGAALLLQEKGRAAEKKKKKTKTVAETSNTAVFNFTGRKDVPDYIANDSSRSPCRPELPKPGEGGIILIPGATILESFTDEDEEILKSLEGPPSPCDVTFINDNVLIDGKSSLSQRTAKQSKLSISFLDGPEVYEYPSETSMMVEEDPPTSHLGHTVPNLSGSTLANYTPKSTEEFHLGVSRTLQPTPTPDVIDGEAMEMEEEEEEASAKPFSEGDIADMLF